MENAFLRKYVMKPKEDGDYLHSSGFGRVQSGDGIGVAGGVGVKRPCEDERKLVGGYGRSGVGGAALGGSGLRPKTYAPPAPGMATVPGAKVRGGARPLPPRRGI